ncbi:hypothetical protein K491DRAFT_684591 [Lophiostoma macrostomum CBS 122681]|uniref:Uncharacterized protein n=1 Tax=Lophiostoma macrostomum CBS 122681 TaxID=1314788 RepID=A0A6A6SLH3_9PLEO|nr:hypothetical protein K491DRAFT_684591 [Lophiostoma macrostomum CBS 122681]
MQRAQTPSGRIIRMVPSPRDSQLNNRRLIHDSCNALKIPDRLRLSRITLIPLLHESPQVHNQKASPSSTGTCISIYGGEPGSSRCACMIRQLQAYSGRGVWRRRYFSRLRKEAAVRETSNTTLCTLERSSQSLELNSRAPCASVISGHRNVQVPTADVGRSSIQVIAFLVRVVFRTVLNSSLRPRLRSAASFALDMPADPAEAGARAPSVDGPTYMADDLMCARAKVSFMQSKAPQKMVSIEPLILLAFQTVS